MRARCSLRLGIFGAEPWTEGMRAEIERRMGIDAVDIYGLSEVMGPGVGQECIETKDGLTLWEDHFFPEIIDPETGKPAARRRDRRTGADHADQGGDAGHPLSHARPDAAVARHGADHAPARAHPGPQRRHADHPRRQRVSDPDRGGAGAARSGSRRTTCWRCGATARSMRSTCWSRRAPRSPARTRTRSCAGRAPST